MDLAAIAMTARAPTRDLPVPESAGAARVLDVCAAKMRAGLRCALATVIVRHGSTPSTPGQKLVLAVDGTAVGTVGGGAVEREVLEALVDVVASPGDHHQVRTFKLGPELGMCCGGRVEVLIESLQGRTPAFVVGAGHVGSALAPLLASLGFAVTLCDMRTEYADDRAIEGVTVVCGDFDEIGKNADVSGICLTMTHDHGLDQDVIEWGLRRGFAFVGGVGSRAKAERTRQRLEHKGFPKEQQERVRMPVGLDIGARLPAEIALAIAAELVRWRSTISAAAETTR
jgi:xanthine dehydrogenase accessory factor